MKTLWDYCICNLNLKYDDETQDFDIDGKFLLNENDKYYTITRCRFSKDIPLIIYKHIPYHLQVKLLNAFIEAYI